MENLIIITKYDLFYIIISRNIIKLTIWYLMNHYILSFDYLFIYLLIIVQSSVAKDLPRLAGRMIIEAPISKRVASQYFSTLRLSKVLLIFFL